MLYIVILLNVVYCSVAEIFSHRRGILLIEKPKLSAMGDGHSQTSNEIISLYNE